MLTEWGTLRARPHFTSQRKRERVCVCEREREKGRERVRVRERERECVCVRERGREREYVWERGTFCLGVYSLMQLSLPLHLSEREREIKRERERRRERKREWERGRERVTGALAPFSYLVQGILKGEVSLYHWPPVWLVWISQFWK
jgi:hypothetical protein